MLVDLRSLKAGDTVEADIAVIGSGPAGITLARELIGSGLRVCLLAGGGFHPDAMSLELNDADALSTHHSATAVQDGRRRQFGGTANMWVYAPRPPDGRHRARMLPPRPVDLMARHGLPLSGWPVGYPELWPFLERAHDACHLGPPDYDPATYAGPGDATLDLEGTDLETVMCQYGAADMFTVIDRDELLRSPDVSLILGASARRLETDGAGDTVRRADAVTSDGRAFSVAAGAYVVASGGVENARLLLNSPAPDGIPLGHRHELVGRHLTEHIEFRLGVIELADRSSPARLGLYDIRPAGGTVVSAMVALRTETMLEHDLLSVGAVLVPLPRGAGSRAEMGLKRLAHLGRQRTAGGVASAIADVVSDPIDAATAVALRTGRLGEGYNEFRGGWSGDEAWLARARTIDVFSIFEQAGHPDDRVELSDRRDRYGQPIARVTWNLHDDDLGRIRRAATIVGDSLGRAGLGRFRPWLDLADPMGPRFPVFAHPMSTTRIHEDPRHGVVDPDCRVHGVANLYIAGSSVFSTGLGFANPTLTIVALALRLADHLRRRGA